MPSLKYEILNVIKELSTPYASITKLSTAFDIDDTNFISAFRELERENLIASANSPHCGLIVGACGTPVWLAVDLYVTQFGIDKLNLSKRKFWPIFIKIIENPTASVLIAALICLCSVLVYSSFGSDQPENKETQVELHKLPRGSQP